MTKRFQRPVRQYSGSEDLIYRRKYAQDYENVPRKELDVYKLDGDFNYLMDAVNVLDEDIRSVVHTGVSESVLEEIVQRVITRIERKLG